MKKSKLVFLSSLFTLAITSCQQQDEWIAGDTNTRDTTSGGRAYRYYRGAYYPIYHGMISPSTYTGATAREISSPGFSPVHTTGSRSGGFGSSSHSYSHGS